MFAWVFVSLFGMAQTVDMISLGNNYSVEVEKLAPAGFRLNLTFDTLKVMSVGDYLAVDLKSTSRYGTVGNPSLPVFRRPFAIPECESVKAVVKSYSVTEFDLSQYGGKKIMPQQPSRRKGDTSQNIVYNKNIYETDGFVGKSVAWFSRVGSMRGVEVGELNVAPMSYNPVTNILRVYNDIVVDVVFESAGNYFDASTCSPYFAQAYSTMLNRDLLDSYSDLYHTPVKMLVVAYEGFETVLQPWIEWKTQKGFYVDVEYVGSDVTPDDIKRTVYARYSEGLDAGNAPVFLVLVGDVDRVPASAVGSSSEEQTDLYYASVDGDYLPEMYCSRMSAETTSELSTIIEKTLMYEKYTMSDPSYLDNVLLIAGQDDYWNPVIAQPTINYATENYFNAAHGFGNVYTYLNSYDGCYSHLSQGVGYAHYTAHGGETCWAGPNLSCDDVPNLLNGDKYFLGIGNCCLSGKFGYNVPCFGEALIRESKGGAFAYIGSSPVTYWYEDYYWALGATSVLSETPDMSQTQTGVFDLMFNDDIFNTVSSIMFGGNLAVTNAYNEGFTGTSPMYYWEAYNVLGDGSIMPYLSAPAANVVSHDTALINGSSFTVEADPGSYVALTDGMVILGTGLVGDNGIANVRLEATASSDSVLLVVTRQQRIPHIEKVRVTSPEGAFITVVDYSPSEARYDVSAPDIFTFEVKNIGLTATETALPMRLRCADSRVVIVDSVASCPTLLPGATAEVADVFSFSVSDDAVDGCQLQFTLAVCDAAASAEYVSNFSVRITKPVLVVANSYVVGNMIPGASVDINITASNRGGTACENVHVALQSLTGFLSVEDSEADYGGLDAGGSADGWFGLSIASNANFGDVLPLRVVLTTETLEFADTINLLVNICDMPISELPYIEDFQSQAIPDCWTQVKQGASTAEWRVVDTDDQSQYANDAGNYYAYLFSSNYTPMSTMLVSPKFNFTQPQRTAYLKFLHIQREWYGDQDKLSIYYKVSDTSEWVLLRTFGSSMSAWRAEQLTLPNLSDSYRIGFSGEVRWGYGIALDEVRVEYEECPVPVVSASQNESGQLILTWTGNAENYVLYKNGNMVAETVSNTYNLDSNEGCYVVEAHCGSDVARSAEYCLEGIADIEADSYKLYPNPAADEVSIDCPGSCAVSIYNSLGGIVLSTNVEPGSTRISLADLPAGVYVVQFETVDGSIVRKKLIRQ